MIAVDDASRDATAEAILSIRDPRITLVRHECNQGVGAAIRTGYRVALERHADVLTVMAGDDQMDPVVFAAVDNAGDSRGCGLRKGQSLQTRSGGQHAAPSAHGERIIIRSDSRGKRPCR